MNIVLSYKPLVEPYSIHGSFLKLEYLKTEFNEDSGTYACKGYISSWSKPAGRLGVFLDTQTLKKHPSGDPIFFVRNF